MRAVYPGTFHPFTAGHADVVDRVRHLFDQITVLVAINPDKQPAGAPEDRMAAVRDRIPGEWANVTVDAWTGLTADYCLRQGDTVIVRGVRNQADIRAETGLAAMNETLGVTTVLVPARPELAGTSSTAERARHGYAPPA